MTTSGDRMEAGIHRMTTIIDVEAGDMILYLNQDIYNFYLLFRETDEYKQLLTASKVKLAMLASFCFFVQLFAGIAILGIDPSLDDSEVAIECDEGAISYPNCVITEDKFVYLYTNKMSAIDFLARLCAVGLMVLYLVPTLTSLPVYNIKLYNVFKSGQGKFTMVAWLLMTALQISLVACVAARAMEIIYKSTSILDVLSAGIGIIIVLEVDSFIFDVSYRDKPEFKQIIEERNLFRLVLTAEDRENTIYSKSGCRCFRFSVDGFDNLMIMVTAIAVFIPTTTASWWYAWTNEGPDGSHEAIRHLLVSQPSIVMVVVVGSLPYAAMVWSWCKKRRSG